MTVEAEARLGATILGRYAGAPSLARRLLRDRRAAFLLAGGINTAFGFLCFACYETLLGPFAGYMAPLVLAHGTSALFAFTTHRRFVFRVTGNLWTDLWRFESVNLISLGLNALLLPLFVEVLGIAVLFAQAISMCVIAVTNWLGHSRFSFRRQGAAL